MECGERTAGIAGDEGMSADIAQGTESINAREEKASACLGGLVKINLPITKFLGGFINTFVS